MSGVGGSSGVVGGVQGLLLNRGSGPKKTKKAGGGKAPKRNVDRRGDRIKKLLELPPLTSTDVSSVVPPENWGKWAASGLRAARLRASEEKTKIALKFEALDALPPPLRKAAMKPPPVDKLPISRGILTETPPIEGYRPGGTE